MENLSQFDVNYVIYGEDVAISLSATDIRKPDDISWIVKDQIMQDDDDKTRKNLVADNASKLARMNPRVVIERLPDDVVNARVVVNRLPDSILKQWMDAIKPKENIPKLGDPNATDEEKRSQYYEFLKSGYGLSCPLCAKNFDMRHKVARHVKEVHLRIHNIFCELCNKSFSSSSHKRVHLETTHNKNTNFECVLCQKTFSAERYMRKHVKTMHSNLGPDWEVTLNSCHYCLQQFSTPEDLNVHLRFHGITSDEEVQSDPFVRRETNNMTPLIQIEADNVTTRFQNEVTNASQPIEQSNSFPFINLVDEPNDSLLLPRMQRAFASRPLPMNLTHIPEQYRTMHRMPPPLKRVHYPLQPLFIPPPPLSRFRQTSTNLVNIPYGHRMKPPGRHSNGLYQPSINVINNPPTELPQSIPLNNNSFQLSYIESILNNPGNVQRNQNRNGADEPHALVPKMVTSIPQAAWLGMPSTSTSMPDQPTEESNAEMTENDTRNHGNIQRSSNRNNANLPHAPEIITTSIPQSTWLEMQSTSTSELANHNDTEFSIDISDSVVVASEEIMALTVDDLKEALQKIDLGLAIFDRSDPNRERSSRVCWQINDAVRCYRDIKRRLN